MCVGVIRVVKQFQCAVNFKGGGGVFISGGVLCDVCWGRWWCVWCLDVVGVLDAYSGFCVVGRL